MRSEARGGEILLSAETTALVRRDLPAGFTIVDLGPHTLRGIEQPERISAIAGPGLETPASASRCPYRGLLSFRPSDRPLFFGRERILDELLHRLSPGTLLALVGASGSGKSSLLHAGVTAAVVAGEVPCARTARVITPGIEPPLELEGNAMELLVIDQFEELYTQCTDPPRRARFIDAAPLARGPRPDRCAGRFLRRDQRRRRLAAAVAANQVLLGPMSEEDLRRAIEAPAQLAGLQLAPGLVDLVLRDAAGRPGSLPLISHALEPPGSAATGGPSPSRPTATPEVSARPSHRQRRRSCSRRQPSNCL